MKIYPTKKEEQICPVCRNLKKLTAHHILPRLIINEIVTEEKKYFLNGDNIYLICSDCHTLYENNATKLKMKLLKNANYSMKSYSKLIKDKDLSKIKNLCRFMTGKYHRNNYNMSVYDAYDFIKRYYGKKYLVYDTILKMTEINDNINNPVYINPGKFVLEKYGLLYLDKEFRKNLNSFLKKKNVDADNLVIKLNKNIIK